MLGVETIIDSDLDNRHAHVIKSRYSINCERQTLSAIGKDLKLSRERVRQLEHEAKQKFYCIVLDKYPDVFRKLTQFAKKSGGIITETRLKAIVRPCGELLDSKTRSKNGESLGLIRLLADICPDLRPLKNDQYLENGWVLKEINIESVKALIDSIIEKLNSNKGPVTLKRLKAEIYSNPHYNDFLFLTVIRSTRNLIVTDGDLIGLRNDRQINPKTVADKIYYVLNEWNKPLHFSEIAQKVSLLNNGREVNKSTIHNELIASDEFILVGRGIYALKKWGYVEGTVAEVILDFLKRQEKPQSLQSILGHVGKERMIKKNTIMVNLAKHEAIAKTKVGEYYVK